MAAQSFPRPRTQLVTGPHPREVLEAALAANAAGDVVINEGRLHLSDELAVRISMPPTPSVRAARATTPAGSPPVRRAPTRFGTIKQLTDSIPFPVVFVIGALFGVIFACVLVSSTRPAKTPVVAQAAPLVLPAAPAAIAVEAAPFVAWAAPPAMPTNEAELHRREAPTPTAHARKRTRTTKRAL